MHFSLFMWVILVVRYDALRLPMWNLSKECALELLMGCQMDHTLSEGMGYIVLVLGTYWYYNS